MDIKLIIWWLYIFWLLHQTTTLLLQSCKCIWLYIFWLLHQTTTYACSTIFNLSCISFDSYIKPQRICSKCLSCRVVYLLTPTSNHNWFSGRAAQRFVVYLLTPTSNHNVLTNLVQYKSLYIFWLLHQTTTRYKRKHKGFCCISFDSYIKPQPSTWCIFYYCVVYLLTPTSNHNCTRARTSTSSLYIFWLLHQTTTNQFRGYSYKGCISFDSYIKPQRGYAHTYIGSSCISFDSYIKPQQVIISTTINISCISFDSYIKPQPSYITPSAASRCISFDSYIKPQQVLRLLLLMKVVYLLTPTSNHNFYFGQSC